MGKPKIRFKGYTEDWEQRKFDDLADYKKGPFGSALKKDMFVPKSDMTVKVYEQQNAINKDWHLERYFITEEYANKLSGFRVEGGDIIVSCAGTIGETYEIPLDAEPGIINQALMRIKVKESIVNKKMFNILFTNMINDFTRVHSNGSAIKNIPPFSDLKPMVVFVPKMDEQNKISSYFSNPDHLITLHQRKCDETKKLKKCMLQKMFPKEGEKVPEIRFSGFTGDWKQRKLGEVFEQTTNFVNPDKGEIELWSLTVEDGLTPKSERYNREFLVKKNANFKKVRPGDIVYNPMNMTLGAVGYNGMLKNVAVSGYYITMFVKTGYDSYYINTWLKSPQALSLYKTFATGSLIEKQRVQFSTLSIIPTVFPEYEEQKRIGCYFNNLDSLITFHQQKCDELKNIKKFMLQNMFVSEK